MWSGELPVAGARFALLHDRVAGTLLVVGADQAGVEARPRRCAVELVDVEALHALVLLGEREHAAERLRSAALAVREALAERDDAARLREPDVTRPCLQDAPGPRRAEAVRVRA